MNAHEMADSIARMMYDLATDDDNPNKAPRCEGCGQRVELAPFQLRASNGSVDMVMYCAECRVLATIVDAEDHASWGDGMSADTRDALILGIVVAIFAASYGWSRMRSAGN